MNLLKTFYWMHLSKPVGDRTVYRCLREIRAQNILEIGLQRGVRTRRMIELAALQSGRETIRYIGLDPFEGRSPDDGPGWSLKKAYHELQSTGVKVRLQPGAPAASLARIANATQNIDLLVIATPNTEWLDAAWHLLPRMLAPQAVALVCDPHKPLEEKSFRRFSKAEIEALGENRRHRPARRAA